jgi:hypothetical protein
MVYNFYYSTIFCSILTFILKIVMDYRYSDCTHPHQEWGNVCQKFTLFFPKMGVFGSAGCLAQGTRITNK